MTTRRDFIRTVSMAITATAFNPSIDVGAADIRTGLILYTVRNEMQKDIDGTLKVVADTGYNWVEAADYANGFFYNMKPADFKRKVESYGLKVLSTHSAVNAENLEMAVADAAGAGMKYLVLPSLPAEWRKSVSSYKYAADFFNIAGEECKKSGLRFGFHNHYVEFKEIDGQIPYDLLVKDTDPDLVTFELDLCWITAGGMRAEDYINKYPGRFELFHMKDMTSKKKDATMGEGMIDFKPIFALTKKAGMIYSFVEQDNCRTHTPFESIKISRNYLLKYL